MVYASIVGFLLQAMFENVGSKVGCNDQQKCCAIVATNIIKFV